MNEKDVDYQLAGFVKIDDDICFEGRWMLELLELITIVPESSE